MANVCLYHVFIRIENDLPLIIDDIIFNLELVEFLNFIKILKRCCEMTMYPWLSLLKFYIKEHVNCESSTTSIVENFTKHEDWIDSSELPSHNSSIQHQL